jgi:metal-responsive CopG/Arc/MetJ family transcriptional regulator
MVMISFNLDEKLDKEIEELSNNKSEFIRQAINEKIGKKDKSLQELTVEYEQKVKEFTELEELYFNMINLTLKHKEQLRLQEIEELTDKVKKKSLQDKLLFERMELLLKDVDEIKNFEFISGWESVANLMPLVDKLLIKGIRTGVVQLRFYLPKKFPIPKLPDLTEVPTSQ